MTRPPLKENYIIGDITLLILFNEFWFYITFLFSIIILYYHWFRYEGGSFPFIWWILFEKLFDRNYKKNPESPKTILHRARHEDVQVTIFFKRRFNSPNVIIDHLFHILMLARGNNSKVNCNSVAGNNKLILSH